MAQRPFLQLTNLRSAYNAVHERMATLLKKFLPSNVMRSLAKLPLRLVNLIYRYLYSKYVACYRGILTFISNLRKWYASIPPLVDPRDVFLLNQAPTSEVFEYSRRRQALRVIRETEDRLGQIHYPPGRFMANYYRGRVDGANQVLASTSRLANIYPSFMPRNSSAIRPENTAARFDGVMSSLFPMPSLYAEMPILPRNDVVVAKPTKSRRWHYLAGGLLCGSFVLYRLVGAYLGDDPFHYVKSKIILYTMRPASKTPAIIRNAFNDLPQSRMPVVPNHTHGGAAADRNSAASTTDRLAETLGMNAHYVQKSAADDRQRRSGSRSLYWIKDLTAGVEPLELPSNPLVVYIDVDQYVDMPRWLCANVHPTVLYTFQPDQVSKVAPDYSYTFDADSQVDYYVAGGGKFQHKVWNYSTDNILVTSTLFGVPFRAAAYLVDRRATSPDHELIMLTPIGSWVGLGALVSSWGMFGQSLKRLNLASRPGFNRLVTASKAGVQVSTGRPGSFASCVVPSVVDDTISTIARTSKYDLTMPQILSFVDGDRLRAAPLLDYHRSEGDSGRPDVVCPVSDGVRSYQFDPHSYEPEAKPSLVAFMSPLVHGAFAPDQTRGNEVQCIEARVEKVRPQELPMTPFLAKTMTEFAQLIIPEKTKCLLDPVDYDEVLTRQNRPTQRRTLANNEVILPERLVKMFVKKEPYPNIKDPRAISQINGVDKREYSCFMYAFETILKKQEWYAFGKTPRTIAERVAFVLDKADYAVNSDFSRFDGHGSNVMRELEKIVLMRTFRVKHHTKLLELHRSQYKLRAVATFGTWYETHYSRASGSPETSLFNSLVNAFVAFLALRMTRVQGVHLSAVEAFDRLGIYGGDDGLTADVESTVYCRAASSIGQELTVEPVVRGKLGIKFLARVYSPDVWFGDVNTCCDLPRQLAKLHVTVQLGPKVTPVMKLLEKTRSFLLTDAGTPVLGTFCRAVMAIHQSEILPNSETENMRTWLSRFDSKNQYQNDPAEWMVDYVAEVMPDFDMKKFTQWVSGANSYVKLMSSPLFQEPILAKSSVPVVIAGEILPYGTHLPVKPERKRLDKRERKVDLEEGGIDNKHNVNLSAMNVAKAVEQRVERTARPDVAGKPRETFEQMKARKQANNTWKEEPPHKKRPPRQQ